jgi:hypothetical protein
VVPATLLKKPLEVFYRCPFLAPDATHGSEGTPHTGVARFLVVVITMAGCGLVTVPRGHYLCRLLPFLTMPWVK